MLGIETSTPVVSAAVVEGCRILGEISLNTRQGHMERLLPVIDQILSASGTKLQDLDGFAVAVGPGSFTSLRVGLATAKALAHALGKPLAGVPTLDALAGTACGALHMAPGLICPVLPARAREVYACFYLSTGCGMKRLSGYLALDPQRLVDRLRQEMRSEITFTGEGALMYWNLLQELGERAHLAGAAQLWPSGAQVAAAGLAQLEQQAKLGQQVEDLHGHRSRSGQQRPPHGHPLDAVRAIYVKAPAISGVKDG